MLFATIQYGGYEFYLVDIFEGITYEEGVDKMLNNLAIYLNKVDKEYQETHDTKDKPSFYQIKNGILTGTNGDMSVKLIELKEKLLNNEFCSWGDETFRLIKFNKNMFNGPKFWFV